MSNDRIRPHNATTDDGTDRPLCLYRGRVCGQPRDIKSNGDLHRFCRNHRQIYNRYQRESQRRKQSRKAMRARTETVNLKTQRLEDLGHVESMENNMSDQEFLNLLFSLFETSMPATSAVQYRMYDVDPSSIISTFESSTD